MPTTTISNVTALSVVPTATGALCTVTLQTQDTTTPPPPSGNPDLIVTGVTWTPLAPKAGDRVIFSATVKNQGGAPTPEGVICGVQFQVDGTAVTFSDTRTAAIAPGTSALLTANGGVAGAPYWVATPGKHSIVAWVDDAARITVETPKGNNTLTVPLAVEVTGNPPPPNNSTITSTLTEFVTALERGDMDVTLTQAIVAPAGGVNIPRKNGRIVRCSGAGLITRGANTGHVLRSDGSGSTMTLVGVRVDGGWRSNPHEGDDSVCNFQFTGFDYLRLDGCVTCYSYRVGFNVYDCKRLEIVNSTMFACPRDTCWDAGTVDYLFENNLLQHCGDDGWGTHFGGLGNGLKARSIICRGNIFRDTFGAKGHGGAADGTINGKPSQVLIENNTFEACGLYGLYFFEDFGNGEPWASPRNITFRNNTIRDLRTTTRSSGNQRIGVAMLLGFPDAGYDATCRLIGNTFIRTPANQGKRLQDAYTWAALNGPNKPQNVPGAAAFAGFFGKNGFQADETFDLASTGYRNDGGGNAGAITHSGNAWQGAGWTTTLS